MAKSVGQAWPTVQRLIELFTAMGCELKTLPGQLTGPDGTHPVRFLYNPENGGFVSLADLADDERLPPSEIDNWERRLGLEVPRGKFH